MGKTFSYKIVAGKKIYKIPDEVCRLMFKAAEEKMKNCYPRANDGYAVTVLTEEGNIYLGVSYKSATETLTMHSEAIALAHAAIHGEKNIIAITGPNCHLCKQLIYESSLRSGINVIVVLDEDGEIKQIPISTLMPYPWPLELEKDRR